MENHHIVKKSRPDQLSKVVRRLALYAALAFIIGHGTIFISDINRRSIGEVEGVATQQEDAGKKRELIRTLRLLGKYRDAAGSIGVVTENLTEKLVEIRQDITDGNLARARDNIASLEVNLTRMIQNQFSLVTNENKEVKRQAEESAKDAVEQRKQVTTLAASLETESQARKEAQRMAEELVEEIEELRKQHEIDLQDMKSFTRIIERDEWSLYERKPITVNGKEYWVDVVTIDLKNPNLRIITDTATDDQCVGACPTKSIKSYYDDHQAFAAISGSYFCPASYSSCTETPGFFPHAIYNSRNKKYFNGGSGSAMISFDKNKGVHFLDYGATPLTKSALDEKIGNEVIAAIANFPMITKNGSINDFDFLLDFKQREVQTRQAAIGSTGSEIKLVTTRSATVPQMAAIVLDLGLKDSLLLDGGSSTTMIYKGEAKIGPGRNMPTAIVFVQ